VRAPLHGYVVLPVHALGEVEGWAGEDELIVGEGDQAEVTVKAGLFLSLQYELASTH
jgi:hypothetical protein